MRWWPQNNYKPFVLVGGVNLWNKCGWQESFRYKQCEAIKSWGARGNSVFWGETQSLYGAIHTQCLWMESDINNRGGGRDQKRAPTPWFQFVHLITLLSVATAPAIMLSQVMVRRRTRISYNSDGVQNTIILGRHAYERERAKGANELIGDAVHVRI